MLALLLHQEAWIARMSKRSGILQLYTVYVIKMVIVQRRFKKGQEAECVQGGRMLLGTKGIATRSEDATSVSWPYY